jgi:hypothetical protein
MSGAPSLDDDPRLQPGMMQRFEWTLRRLGSSVANSDELKGLVVGAALTGVVVGVGVGWLGARGRAASVQRQWQSKYQAAVLAQEDVLAGVRARAQRAEVLAAQKVGAISCVHVCPFTDGGVGWGWEG